VKTTVIGAFPKISDQPGGQELRQALHKQDRGELKEHELDAVYDAVTTSAIGELEAAGIDVINDGQVRWDDLLAPFASAWKGVKRGPLERFYDNNTYFRQPMIDGPITSDGTTMVKAFRFAKTIAARELKAAVAGPITFATLSIDKHYRSLEDRVLAVADDLALGRVVRVRTTDLAITRPLTAIWTRAASLPGAALESLQVSTSG